MKNLPLLLFGAIISLLFIQCQDDEILETPLQNSRVDNDTIFVDGAISADEIWTSGNTYILTDLVAVLDNATLTIEPCVLVKAEEGATGLIITPGSKLNAEGTADCPIIFTSANDQLEPGDIVSPNLTGDDVGLWGGIFILGNAPVSDMSNPAIMSLLPQNQLHTFGGTDANDNSGIMKYVSIRHTGFETAPAETPSGLSMGGVGNGTTIDNVELFANADDGFLMIGGTVNVTNVITSYFKDDGYDCDRGYAGTMDNLIGIGASSSNSSLELSGGEGAENPSFTISNASFKGSQSGEDYIDFQQNVNCVIENSYFFGFDDDAIVVLDNDRDADNWISELIDVRNLQFNTSHLSSGNLTVQDIFRNNAFNTRMPDANIVTSPSTGANKNVFEGWTVADASGALNDF